LTLDSATGLVVDSNPFLSELLEIPAEGLRGRRLWEVQAFQNAGFSKEACEDLRVRGSLELDELIFLGRDGNRIFVDFSAHAFEIGGGKFVSCRILDITPRKLLEESLRESQRKLRAVFDQTFQFIGLLSPDGILLDANRTALDFAGVALSAVVRKPYWDTPWWTHSPEQAERLRRAVRRSARGEFVRFEATHAAADGSLHYIDFSLKPVQNEEGRVAFLIFEGRNVTGTKKAVESAMIFFSGVEKAFDGFILMDTRGGITYANDSALQACGLSLREAKQMNFGDLLRPKDAAPELLSHALEKGKWLGEAQRLARGAGEFPAEMSLSAVRDSNGAPIAVLAVFRDASERVRAEKDLKSAKEDLEEKVLQRTVALTRANLELKKLSETLARAGKAKSDFLANMSHELRTPMNSIIGFSEVLQGESFGGLNQRQKDYVGYILISGKHLLSLINDVLDLSKVEAGRMELSPCEFSLSGLLDQAALWVQRAAQEKKIAVSREVPGDIGTLVGDERKIRQVLCNLLSNAVKFTPAGGRVGVRMKRTPEGVEVEVWDTGVGLSATDLGRIFSPFTRVESPLSRETQGAGLGLSLSRELVELHGGKIWIESDGPGKGASAKFTLPPSPPAAPEAA
jgi:PAS domain S-box-containing protein